MIHVSLALGTFGLVLLMLKVLLLQKKTGLVGPRDGGEDASLLIRDPWLERSGLSEDHFRSLRLPGGERVRDDHGHGLNDHHARQLHGYYSRLNIATHSC